MPQILRSSGQDEVRFEKDGEHQVLGLVAGPLVAPLATPRGLELGCPDSLVFLCRNGLQGPVVGGIGDFEPPYVKFLCHIVVWQNYC